MASMGGIYICKAIGEHHFVLRVDVRSRKKYKDLSDFDKNQNVMAR